MVKPVCTLCANRQIAAARRAGGQYRFMLCTDLVDLSEWIGRYVMIGWKLIESRKEVKSKKLKVKNTFRGRFLLIGFLCCLFVLRAEGKVIYVDAGAGAGPGGDGTSWATAYVELQSALGEAEYGDEIRIAAGTYKPDYDPNSGLHTGNREMSFEILNGVALYGGFPVGGGEWQERDPNAYETILSGDLAKNDGPNYTNYEENSYHVVIGNGTEDNAVVDGVTIMGGNSSRYYQSGAALLNYDGELRNCAIRNNKGSLVGGALNDCDGSITSCIISGNYGSGVCECESSISHCTISGNFHRGLFKCNGLVTNCVINGNTSGGLFDCDGVIMGCTIADNSTSAKGGGLKYCDGLIKDCIIRGNSAGEYGGGIIYSNGSIIDCTISGNTAGDSGGGLYDCDGPIINCIISGNSASWTDGGGLCKCNGPITGCVVSGNSAYWGAGISQCDSFPITGCVIIGNKSDYGSGGLDGCYSIISNCIIWENRPYDEKTKGRIVYSCVQGGWSGAGCIDFDPGFVSPGYWDLNGTAGDPNDDFWVDGDYHLRIDSPCINSGRYGYYIHLELPIRDLDSHTRVVGGQVDMGCYEYGGQLDTDGDWVADWQEPGYVENPDRDADGLFDGSEMLRGTNPNMYDPLGQLQVPDDVPSIQDTLFLSRSSETIQIKPGIYKENLYIGGKNLILTGMDPYDTGVVESTIIDGDGDGNPNTTSGRVVTFTGTEDESCQIQGLTITGGDLGGGIYGAGCEASIFHCVIRDNFGSGLRKCNGPVTGCTISGNSWKGLYECRGPITGCMISGNIGSGMSNCYGPITDCVIHGNTAYAGGGLQHCAGSIKDCEIRDNSAKYDGGGLSNFTGLITNCTIRGNIAGECGGGIYSFCWCELTLINCNISGNRADIGGGMCYYEGTISLTNSTVTGNRAFIGGGMYNNSNSQIVTNCAFSGNKAPNGNALAFDNYPFHRSSTMQMKNCILWDGGDEIWNNDGSLITIRYSDIQGSWSGLGNIDVDPLFVREGYWEDNGTREDESDDYWVEGDYHLRSEGWRWDGQKQRWRHDKVTSRCIDAGNPGSLLENELLRVPKDRKNKRGVNLRINMGAYGGTAEASMGPYGWVLLSDLTNDGIVNMVDYNWQAADWLKTAEEQAGDLNRDGVVDCMDLELLVGDWLDHTSWYE